MEKVFKKEAPIGTVEIIAKYDEEENKTSIEVRGEGITHKSPEASYVGSDGVLYVRDAKYKRKKLSGIRDVIGLKEWWDEVQKIIKEKEEEKKRQEIERDKKKKFTRLSINTYLGAYSNNNYINMLLDEMDKEKVGSFIQKEFKDKYVETEMGDYTYTEIYEIETDRLAEFLKKLKIQLEKMDKEDKLKSLEKNLKRIEEKIKKGKVPYKNLIAIDVDLVTGRTFYKLEERIPLEDFNKVRKYFEYISETPSEEFDPMSGTRYRGWATTQPEKVCDILYPEWREEGMKYLKEEYERIKKEIEKLRKKVEELKEEAQEKL